MEHFLTAALLLFLIGNAFAMSFRSKSFLKMNKRIAQSSNSSYFSQSLDHFDASNHNKWMQRYFVNDTFFKARNNVSNVFVFLCVGGEGPPLEATVVITGDNHCADLIQQAQVHSALIFALEHRYYGESIPTTSLSTTDLKYLSSKQALADINNFISGMNTAYSLPSTSKWVTFGGSYPGMLAAWARLKYETSLNMRSSS
jgi:thymus-specific serine protease